MSSANDAMYRGKPHTHGGIKVVVNSTTGKDLIEVEGLEYKICKEAYNSPKELSFSAKTNKEILDYIHDEFSCEFDQSSASSSDFIVCKNVVFSGQRNDRKGTVKQILNEMQGEKGCRVEGYAAVKTAKGGELILPVNGDGLFSIIPKEEIAEKHNVPLRNIKEQMKKGIIVEHEHTDNDAIAEAIASHHLLEIPDYYTQLEKIEGPDNEKAKKPLKKSFAVGGKVEEDCPCQHNKMEEGGEIKPEKTVKEVEDKIRLSGPESITAEDIVGLGTEYTVNKYDYTKEEADFISQHEKDVQELNRMQDRVINALGKNEPVSEIDKNRFCELRETVSRNEKNIPKGVIVEDRVSEGIPSFSDMVSFEYNEPIDGWKGRLVDIGGTVYAIGLDGVKNPIYWVTWNSKTGLYEKESKPNRVEKYGSRMPASGSFIVVHGSPAGKIESFDESAFGKGYQREELDHERFAGVYTADNTEFNKMFTGYGHSHEYVVSFLNSISEPAALKLLRAKETESGKRFSRIEATNFIKGLGYDMIYRQEEDGSCTIIVLDVNKIRPATGKFDKGGQISTASVSTRIKVLKAMIEDDPNNKVLKTRLKIVTQMLEEAEKEPVEQGWFKTVYAYKENQKVVFLGTGSEIFKATVKAPSTISNGVQMWLTDKGYVSEEYMLPEITSAKQVSNGGGYKAFRGMGGGKSYKVEFADGRDFSSNKSDRASAIEEAVRHRLFMAKDYPKTYIQEAEVKTQPEVWKMTFDEMFAATTIGTNEIQGYAFPYVNGVKLDLDEIFTELFHLPKRLYGKEVTANDFKRELWKYQLNQIVAAIDSGKDVPQNVIDDFRIDPEYNSQTVSLKLALEKRADKAKGNKSVSPAVEKSILNQSVDLLGDEKEEFMFPVVYPATPEYKTDDKVIIKSDSETNEKGNLNRYSIRGKDGEEYVIWGLDNGVNAKVKASDIIGYADVSKRPRPLSGSIEAIEYAMAEGLFHKAIDDGRMSANDAAIIIGSSGLKIPTWLLKLQDRISYKIGENGDCENYQRGIAFAREHGFEITKDISYNGYVYFGKEICGGEYLLEYKIYDDIIKKHIPHIDLYEKTPDFGQSILSPITYSFKQSGIPRELSVTNLDELFEKVSEKEKELEESCRLIKTETPMQKVLQDLRKEYPTAHIFLKHKNDDFYWDLINRKKLVAVEVAEISKRERVVVIDDSYILNKQVQVIDPVIGSDVNHVDKKTPEEVKSLLDEFAGKHTYKEFFHEVSNGSIYKLPPFDVYDAIGVSVKAHPAENVRLVEEYWKAGRQRWNQLQKDKNKIDSLMEDEGTNMRVNNIIKTALQQSVEMDKKTATNAQSITDKWKSEFVPEVHPEIIWMVKHRPPFGVTRLIAAMHLKSIYGGIDFWREYDIVLSGGHNTPEKIINELEVERDRYRKAASQNRNAGNEAIYKTSLADDYLADKAQAAIDLIKAGK